MSALLKENKPLDYSRLSFLKLQGFAHDQEWWDREEAIRQYCLRIVDMAVEVALDIRHTEGYFPPESPTAKIGQPVGGSGPRETLAYICDRPMPDSKLHKECFNKLKMLNSDKMIALLIRGAKKSGNTQDGWDVGYDKIAANISHYVRLLGFSPVMEDVHYASGKSIETKAYRGLSTLMVAAAKEVI